MPTLRARLLDPLGPGGRRAFRRAAFDHRADAPVDAPLEHADHDALLIFDGVFLQEPRLDGALDYVIFLDAPFEVTQARCAVRGAIRGAAPASPDDPAARRYVEGQRLYLRRDDPRGQADLLVDYRDLSAPVIVRSG